MTVRIRSCIEQGGDVIRSAEVARVPHRRRARLVSAVQVLLFKYILYGGFIPTFGPASHTSP